MPASNSSQLKSDTIFPNLAFPLRVSRGRQESTVGSHSHDFVEMVYVVKGVGQHQVSNHSHLAGKNKASSLSYQILEGDIFVIAPGEEHAYGKQDNLEIYNILFLPSLLENDYITLQEIPDLFNFLVVEPCFREETEFRGKLRLPLATRSKVETYLNNISKELKEGKVGSKAMVKGMFLELLVTIGRAYNSMVSLSDQGADLQGKREAVEKAVAYIEKKYSGSISLDEISKNVYLSSHYFCKLFKESTGLSVWEYLTRIRLDQAKKLLQETDKSITEIAMAVGLGDSSYFAKVFKARESISPRKFRNL